MWYYFLNFNYSWPFNNFLYLFLNLINFRRFNNPINNSITNLCNLQHFFYFNCNRRNHFLFIGFYFLNDGLIIRFFFNNNFNFLFDNWFFLNSFNFNYIWIRLHNHRNYFFSLSINLNNLFTNVLNWN